MRRGAARAAGALRGGGKMRQVGRDKGAAATPGGEIALGHELIIGGGDGHSRHRELCREAAAWRQGQARQITAAQQQRAQPVAELLVQRRGLGPVERQRKERRLEPGLRQIGLRFFVDTGHVA